MQAPARSLAAGQERYLSAGTKVGFHRSGLFGYAPSTTWNPVDHEIAAFYKSRETSEDFIKQALDTPFNKIWNPRLHRCLPPGTQPSGGARENWGIDECLKHCVWPPTSSTWTFRGNAGCAFFSSILSAWCTINQESTAGTSSSTCAGSSRSTGSVITAFPPGAGSSQRLDAGVRDRCQFARHRTVFLFP